MCLLSSSVAVESPVAFLLLLRGWPSHLSGKRDLASFCRALGEGRCSS